MVCQRASAALVVWPHAMASSSSPQCRVHLPPVLAELMQQCWAADPYARPPFAAVHQRLSAMLGRMVQDQGEARARFVADL